MLIIGGKRDILAEKKALAEKEIFLAEKMPRLNKEQMIFLVYFILRILFWIFGHVLVICLQKSRKSSGLDWVCGE